MHMSVPGDTKCHIVQILFVIGVTITLVTSCWARGVSFPPSVCCSKQPTTRRYFPGLIITPSYKEGRVFGYPTQETASIHRAAEKGCSRKVGFRLTEFSETPWV